MKEEIYKLAREKLFKPEISYEELNNNEKYSYYIADLSKWLYEEYSIDIVIDYCSHEDISCVITVTINEKKGIIHKNEYDYFTALQEGVHLALKLIA